jgi:hypothetical protein
MIPSLTLGAGSDMVRQTLNYFYPLVDPPRWPMNPLRKSLRCTEFWQCQGPFLQFSDGFLHITS